jgi:hypothetical protein
MSNQLIATGDPDGTTTMSFCLGALWFSARSRAISCSVILALVRWPLLLKPLLVQYLTLSFIGNEVYCGARINTTGWRRGPRRTRKRRDPSSIGYSVIRTGVLIQGTNAPNPNEFEEKAAVIQATPSDVRPSFWSISRCRSIQTQPSLVPR